MEIRTGLNNSQPRSAQFHQDTDGIKSRIDLRELVRSRWGDPKRQTPKRDQHFARWRDDGNLSSFNVWENRFKDFGGAGESGDVFAFLMRDLNTDFKGALDYAIKYIGGAVASVNIPAPEQVRNIEPTPAEWQQQTTQFIEYAQKWLWSDRSEAKKILTYLKHDRGLTDETIKAFKIGYNPQWAALKGIGKAAPGIIIPYFDATGLTALRIRTKTGKLATALGIKSDIGKDGAELPKYLNVAGSRVSGSLFNAHTIQPGLDVLFVEGEFDAILAHQEIGHMVSVVTLGAASNRLTEAHRTRLQAAGRIYLTLDNDDAGNNASKELRAKLTEWDKQPTTLKLPIGKDVCEYVADHWGDLGAWYKNATVLWWAGQGMPDSWRSAMLNYMPTGAAMMAEIINAAVVNDLINPKRFTRAGLYNAVQQLHYNIPSATFYTLFSASKTELFSLLGIEYGVLNTIPKTKNNPPTGGRPTDYFCVITPVELRQRVESSARFRLWEHYHPAEGDYVISTLDRGMVDLIDTTEDKDDLALELAAEVDDAAARQEDKKAKAGFYFRHAFEKFRTSLNELHSTPLPEWPITTAGDYVTAFARALGQERVEKRTSLSEWSRMLGISVNSVPNVLKRAGLGKVNKPQFEYVDIDIAENIVQEVATKSRYLKAYPRFIVVRDNHGQEITSEEYHAETAVKFAKKYRVLGCKVEVKMQAANVYQVVSDAPVAVTTPARSHQPIVATPSTPVEPEFEIVRPFRERRFNPAWVANQFRLVLQKQNKWIRGWEFVGFDDDVVITRDCRELAELIIGRRIAVTEEPFFEKAG